MIQEGLLEQGFEIVESVRKRFDGVKRNPWNEFECGSNYARSMASFALVPSICGYVCDLYRKKLRFAPKWLEKPLRALWSNSQGWGEYRHDDLENLIDVLYGTQTLLALELPVQGQTPHVLLNGQRIPAEQDGETVRFAQPLSLKAGDTLLVSY